jgi:serine/threonine protein kinase
MDPMLREPGFEASSSPRLEPNDWRGTARYEVVRCIGRGTMGVVYEARDRERRKHVAVKTLRHVNPSALFLFKQEFRTLADVQHRNLVRLYELVAAEGERVFFSMELVRGTDFLVYVQKPGAAAGLAGVREKTSTLAPPNQEGARRPEGSRGSSAVDLDRLRPALRQLVEGVQALHSAGKVHRDLKSSNVIVTPEGRVVLLDFGVATEVTGVTDENLREDGPMVGTARYMAPEQAVKLDATRASDWYSVGVMLYEALVGRAPFEGAVLELMRTKAAVDARPPSESVDGVPQDLDALCVALLDRDPDKRPTGPQLLRRLGAIRASSAPPAMSLDTVSASLIGREAQLRALRGAFDSVRSGRSVTVRVGGHAGMGKSTLIQHFLDGLVRNGEAVVLRGRAYERESVPYKAVDTVIDALSRYLMHVFDDEDALALPKDMAALTRLFPVLARIPAVREISGELLLDPLGVRRRAFAALRELMTTLGRRRPLVVFIDDVQWGDTDSATLLLELVRPPSAPPLLFVLAHREEDAPTSAFLTEVRTRWPVGAEARDVSVGPLELADVRRLSLAIAGSDDKSAEAVAEAAVRESGGNPLLVEELTRSSIGRPMTATGAKVTLEQMVGERLSQLSDDARRIAEIVAISGRPMPVSIVGDAAGVVLTEDIVALLSMQRLLRSGLRDGREVVEPFHDRIREAVVALLPATAVQENHRRLARALLATHGADPEAVAVHLLGVGEVARGARFAERAAKQAAKQLAFDHATRLYRLTLDALPTNSPKRTRLRSRLGEVLGWAGRSEEAGRAYLAAAELAAGTERLTLNRAASEQLLAAGRIEEGGQVLRRVLVNAGVGAPASPLSAVFWLIIYKLRLQVSGLKYEARRAEDVSPEKYARIDALNVAAVGLASVDTILAACMQARQMVEALRRGDRGQVLRAGVIYGIHLATRGGSADRHERQLHETIEHLTRQPDASAEEVAYARGTGGVGLFLRGRWREALRNIDEAYANMPSQVAGWQRQASLYAVYALVFLGDLVEVRRRVARQLADADQRGDLFTSVQLRASHPAVLLLAADDVEAAHRQTREAKSQWTQTKFLTQHWQLMRSEAETELYAGRGAKAYERLGQDARALKKSLLLNVQFTRGVTNFARGRAAIASMDTADATQRSSRLVEARRMAAQLQQENMTWTAPLAAILKAATENAASHFSLARALLEKASELAQAADMSLYAAACRHQLGLSMGGPKGAQLVEQACKAMQAQEIRVPARFATMLVPGQWGLAEPNRAAKP